jgi:endonuclease III
LPAPAAETAQKDVKRKLTRVARALEEKYGPHIYPEDLNPLEQIMFAILASGNPVTNAKKAIREFKDQYVDWNEARTATIRMIEETLERANIDNPGRYAEVLKQLLQKVFDEVCRMSLDGLRADGPEKARKTVAKLDILEPHEQQYLLVGAGVEEAPPLDPCTDRVLERVGVFTKDEPPPKRRKLLETLVAATDALRFHHLMVEHGKKLCTEEDPYPVRCVRCPAQADCDYFKTREQQARVEAKSPKPKAATPAPAKAAGAAAAAGTGAAPKVKKDKDKAPPPARKAKAGAKKGRGDEDEE